MSTNLRLSEAAAVALRQEAERTGRSQQQVMREALDLYLGLRPTVSDRARARSAGTVRAGSAFRDVEPPVHLAPGTSSLDLLDRDDER